MIFSKLLKLAAVGSAVVISQTSCDSQISEYPFVEVVQYRANTPIEDRHCFTKLKSIKGFTASVFDGHGGDLTSQYASKQLNTCIDDRIESNKKLGLPNNKLIEKSLSEAYNDVEQGFFNIFKEKFEEFPKYKTVGSCALTAVILKDSLHVANAGDCQGVLLSEKEAAMTNLRLNAGEIFEQSRLYKQFPGEKDIVVCQGACYVKGRLQPTRSFGDFYLKHKQYNFTRLKVFTGPYIDHMPLITHFALTSKHDYLLLASDGLWDELNDGDIHSIYTKKPYKLGKAVFDRAIKQILERNRINSFQNLNKIDNRRNLHDDITIVNLDLQTLRKEL